jgi:hypothetical protein
MKTCIYCAEEIRQQAIVCRYCTRPVLQDVAQITKLGRALAIGTTTDGLYGVWSTFSGGEPLGTWEATPSGMAPVVGLLRSERAKGGRKPSEPDCGHRADLVEEHPSAIPGSQRVMIVAKAYPVSGQGAISPNFSPPGRGVGITRGNKGPLGRWYPCRSSHCRTVDDPNRHEAIRVEGLVRLAPGGGSNPPSDTLSCEDGRLRPPSGASCFTLFSPA